MTIRVALGLLAIGSLLVIPLGAGAAPLSQPSPLTISPTSGPPGTVVQYSGIGFTPGGRVSVLLIQGLGLIVDEVTADAGGGVSGSFRMPAPRDAAELGFGPVEVFAIDEASGQETAATIFLLTEPAAATTWYFAEGSTALPFDEVIAILNPHGQAAAQIQFQLESGQVITRTLTVPPQSKLSVRVDEIVPKAAVSAWVVTTLPMVVERTMFIRETGSVGAHNTIGIRAE